MVVKNIISEQIEECLTYISDINNYIVPPKLKNNAGILGAIALAKSKFD